MSKFKFFKTHKWLFSAENIRRAQCMLIIKNVRTCSFCNVPFLECALFGTCPIWNVLFLEWALFGMCPFWNVLFLECAIFGMCSFWNVPFLECSIFGICPFRNVPLLEYAIVGICHFWNVPILEFVFFGTFQNDSFLEGKDKVAIFLRLSFTLNLFVSSFVGSEQSRW